MAELLAVRWEKSTYLVPYFLLASLPVVIAMFGGAAAAAALVLASSDIPQGWFVATGAIATLRSSSGAGR